MIFLLTQTMCIPGSTNDGGTPWHRAWAVCAASVVQKLHRAGVVWGSVRPDTFIVKSGDSPFPVLLATDFSRAAVTPSSKSKGEDHPWVGRFDMDSDTIG